MIRFIILLEFDEKEFNPDKLTKEFVERVAKDRLGGKGVNITVFGE